MYQPLNRFCDRLRTEPVTPSLPASMMKRLPDALLLAACKALMLFWIGGMLLLMVGIPLAIIAWLIVLALK